MCFVAKITHLIFFTLINILRSRTPHILYAPLPINHKTAIYH